MRKNLGFGSILFLIALPVMLSGCAGDGYRTQSGAAIGAALGAGYGQAIGRDTESTLLGMALGGLTGAVIGNYEDQRSLYQNAYRPPRYRERYQTYSAPPSSGQPYCERGEWVTVPGQYVGGYYVPPHPAWAPSQDPEGIVVERR